MLENFKIGSGTINKVLSEVEGNKFKKTRASHKLRNKSKLSYYTFRDIHQVMKKLKTQNEVVYKYLTSFFKENFFINEDFFIKPF